tara:strand:- start:7 stop:243 length:237 start_codon:yes stop_codon:yes gene_type:complete
MLAIQPGDEQPEMPSILPPECQAETKIRPHKNYHREGLSQTGTAGLIAGKGSEHRHQQSEWFAGPPATGQLPLQYSLQ